MEVNKRGIQKDELREARHFAPCLKKIDEKERVRDRNEKGSTRFGSEQEKRSHGKEVQNK